MTSSRLLLCLALAVLVPISAGCKSEKARAKTLITELAARTPQVCPALKVAGPKNWGGILQPVVHKDGELFVALEKDDDSPVPVTKAEILIWSGCLKPAAQ